MLTVAQVLSDFGLGSAIIQREKVTDIQRSTLFWVGLLFSTIVSLVIYITGSVISVLMNEERLGSIVSVASFLFVVQSVGQQIKMNAEKDLQFKIISLSEILSSVVGLTATILLALYGFGVVSVVIGGVISAAVMSSLSWIFLSKGWRPLFIIRIESVRDFLKFGGAVSANNLVNQVNATLDIFIGGIFISMSSLGLYSVPRNLVLQMQLLLNQIVNRISFPLISAQNGSRERVEKIYITVVGAASSANAMLYSLLIYFSSEIGLVVLGEQWKDSGVLFTLLGLWGYFRSVLNPVGSLLYGMGRADKALQWSFMLLLLGAPLIYVGSFFGATGLASAMLFIYIILFVPAWRFLVFPFTGIKLSSYSFVIIRPLILSSSACVIAVFFVWGIGNPAVRLSLGVFISFVLYLLLSYFMNREVVKLIRSAVLR